MSNEKNLKTLYATSRDYKLLHRLLCGGFSVAAYVDSDINGRKALCTIVRRGDFNIDAYGRGISYFSIHPWMQEDWCNPHNLDEAGMFIIDCQKNNVEFIVGIHSDAIALQSTQTNIAG